MKKALIISVLVLANTAIAQTANPFKPAPAAPAQPAAPGGAGVPSNQSVPGNQSNPGMPPAVPFPGGAPNIGPNGMPMYNGAPAPGPEIVEEEVQATKIGKVNGLDIYRGTNTYVFDKPNPNRKVVRRPVTGQTAGAASQSPLAAGAQGVAQGANALPSMVGRPAPTN